MKKETIMKIGIPVAAVIASVGLGFAGITSAQSAATTGAGQMRMMKERPAAIGKVTAISGSTITIIDTNPKTSVATTYTVNASGATVMKGSAGAAPATVTLADIAVGDTIAVEGTVSGTTITATKIMDGVGMMGGHGMGERGGHGMGMGMGQGTGGTVTAISGSTITVTGRDGTSYTINADGAKVSKMITGSLSDIKVGDIIGAQGTRSGTTVTATQIMTGLPAAPTQQ